MPAGANGRAHLSIGEVLSLLQEEFPDVTISKIRFLESQGLLDPERTPSGYRKFYDYDIERLRWILRLQKDHYLPLKVIKDRLDEGGAVPPSANGAGVLPFPGIGAGADGAADGRGVSVGGPGSTDETEEIVGSAGTEGDAGAAAPGGRRAAPGPARTARDGRPREGRRASRVARSTASRSAATAGRARDGSPSASSTPPASLGARSADGTAGGSGTGSGSGHAGSAAANDGAATPSPSPSTSPSPRAAADRTPPGGGGPRRPTGGRGASGGSPPPSRGGGGSTPGTYGADRSAQAPGASTPADPSARMNGHTAYDPGPDAVSLTVDELAEASGLSLRDIRDLERFGLIEPRDGVGGSAYDGDALIVARTAAGFLQHGIEARHMRTYKVAVDREAGLFQQIVSPVLKQRNPEARTRAARTITELIRLGEVMRGVLLRRELRDHTGGG